MKDRNDNRMELAGRHHDSSMVAEVYTATMAQVQHLAPGRKYLAEDILAAIWNARIREDNRGLGQILASLVRARLVPLRPLAEKAGTSVQYELDWTNIE